MRALLILATALALAMGGCGGGGAPAPSPKPSTASMPAPDGAGAADAEKSIEGFGAEAAGAERASLLAAFHAYMGAIAARDYPTACRYLSAAVRRSLEQLVAGGAKQPRCAAILPRLLAPTAATIAHEQGVGDVTKVRVRGERAFVVLHAPGARLYQLTMAREAGDWKTTTISASVLVPSAATLGQR